MNLTKRILTGLTAAGLCALTASAETFEDVFETYETWFTTPQNEMVQTNAFAGMPLDDYKTVWTAPEGTPVANRKWEVGGGDSAIAAYGEGDAKYQGVWPTNATTQDLYLNLNTEGGLATRTFGTESLGTEEEPSDPIYVDTLIKFTVSDGEPEIGDELAKLAIWVNEASNLVVKSAGVTGTVGQEDFGFTDPICTTNTGTVINPDQWYRLTVATISHGYGIVYCKVWLNGSPIQGPLPEAGFQTGDTGTGFPCLKRDAYSLQQVSFQGTGCIDDLVVTRAAPSFGASTAFVLTIAYDSTMLDVTKGGGAVAPNATVDSGAELTITAKPWHRITGISGDGVTVDGAPAYPADTATVTFTADAEGKTATIAAEKMNDHRAGKLVDWAIKNNISEDAATPENVASWFAAYLLNVAPDATNTAIKITSINIETNGVTITTRADDGNVDITKRNGKLVLQAVGSLTNSFSDVASVNLSDDETEKQSVFFSGIDFTAKDSQFFRVVLEDNVEEPPPAAE